MSGSGANPRQRQLFPEAFDVEADALDALGELDCVRGLAAIRRARAADPDLANLDAIEAALVWLGESLEPGRADATAAARAFLARPRAQLSPGAAQFADRALARFGLRRAQDGFLDGDRLVPRGALLLVEDRPAAAQRELTALIGEHPARADILGYAADAAWLVDRADLAHERMTRALLLDPSRVDLERQRRPDLAALWRELRAAYPEPLARARLFPEAWLRGLLSIPPGNAWLDTDLSRAAALARGRDKSSEEARLRRFALLLYRDRTRPRGTVSLEEREELAELEPELFRRMIERVRREP